MISVSLQNYMWHHAMITINETGFGQMIIDGEVSQSTSIVVIVSPA